jgi:signal peptidase I
LLRAGEIVSIIYSVIEKEKFILLTRSLSILFNLILPGAGLALLGRRRWACLIQLFFILSVTTLCWSRLVFEPWAIQVLLGVIGGIYLVGTARCFTGKRPTSIKPLRQWLLASGFFVVSLSGLVASFVYKQHWLGIHLYFVPSMSMHPTLKPGQFILVDTWAYQDKTPSLNDVVVFEHGVERQHLVKRINHWPTGETIKNNLWYVVGDNRNYSQDSRYFGGIASKQLIGKVTLVLIALDKEHPLNIDIVLTPVH